MHHQRAHDFIGPMRSADSLLYSCTRLCEALLELVELGAGMGLTVSPAELLSGRT